MARIGAQDAAFLAAGLLGLAAQVLLLRELIVDVAGDELAIGVGLAAWLLGVALGAFGARALAAGKATWAPAVGIALLAVLLVSGIVGGRVLRSVLGPGAGELPGLGLTLTLAAVMLLLPGTTVGWTFTALASSASGRDPAGGIARVYVFESLGAVLGGLAVTILVGRHLSPLVLAAVVGLVASLLALAGVRGGTMGGRGLLAPAAALCALLVLVAPRLDSWSEGVRFAGVAPGVPLQGVRDTPRQHLALGGHEGQWHLYSSGQYEASFPDDWSAEIQGHLLATLAPRPQRVLLGGGVAHGLTPVILQHPVRELVVVVPGPSELAFLRDRLGDHGRRALENPRVRVVFGDVRRVLARQTGRFGLIVVPGTAPVTLLQARLATAEFFRLCAGRLAPDGVLVAGIPTAPNALVDETAAMAGSIAAAAREALPVVRATPGPDTLLVAGWDPQAATLDPDVLAERWRGRGIASASFGGAILPTLLPPGRVAAMEAALLDASSTAVVSRDDRPASFLHALARRQRTTAAGGAGWLAPLTRAPAAALAGLVLLPSLLVLAWTRARPLSLERRAAAAASHAVAAGGAAGMGLSLLVLLSFQTRVGLLYGALGVLSATFMLGLALGATLAQRSVQGGVADPVVPLRVALASAFAFAATLPWTLGAAAQASDPGLLAGLLAHGALLLAGGVVTGAVFPLASAVRLHSGDGAASAAGRLETADHVGAALAALVSSVLLLPRLGFARTAWLAAALLALGLAGTLLPGRERDEG